jgi:hypothetical protein
MPCPPGREASALEGAGAPVHIAGVVPGDDVGSWFGEQALISPTQATRANRDGADTAAALRGPLRLGIAEA